ncbi:MAG: WG repeat-containing protein [Oscillospiraceae bacterium]|jgi:hypothetical protein|nr:WG repeat-containing protein [Oscillospiraceae bacterium]
MKRYKLLVPAVLIALFAVSVYMLYGANADIEDRYKENLEAARLYARQGIIVDAAVSYGKTLEIRNSFELQMEIAEFYRDGGELDKAVNWGYEMLGDYPKSSEVYLYLMEIFAQAKDYAACFQLFDTMQKRGAPTEPLAELMEELDDLYFFHGGYEDVSVFGGGYCAVMTNGAWGFVNEEGRRVVKSRFAEVGAFRQDLAPVLDGEMQAYFIDTDGNKKKTALGVENVQKLGCIEDGVYTLYNGDTWGLYNGDNELIVGGFDEASSFMNGAVAVRRGEKWSVLGGDGAAMTPDTYDGVVRDEKGAVYRSGRLFVLENGGYYLIDGSGRRITETRFEDARLFNDATYAAVKSGGKWGFIDTDGKYFIEPEYDAARSFSNGFAAVKTDGKWGFIDAEKRLAIENIFEDAKDFNSRGCAFVRGGGDWELLKLYKFNH